MRDIVNTTMNLGEEPYEVGNIFTSWATISLSNSYSAPHGSLGMTREGVGQSVQRLGSELDDMNRVQFSAKAKDVSS